MLVKVMSGFGSKCCLRTATKSKSRGNEGATQFQCGATKNVPHIFYYS